MEKIITTSSAQTKKLGKLLTEELRGEEVICLDGDLGAGKTTFTQGLLKGLGAKGPFTSPTFAILKEYKLKAKSCKLKAVYHIDAYRITDKDLLELGWKDFAGKQNTVTIVEWSDRIKKILPKNALKISFKWIDDRTREITLKK